MTHSCFLLVTNILKVSPARRENKRQPPPPISSCFLLLFGCVPVCLCSIVIYLIISRVHRCLHVFWPPDRVKWALQNSLWQMCCLNLWNPKGPGSFFKPDEAVWLAASSAATTHHHSTLGEELIHLDTAPPVGVDATGVLIFDQALYKQCKKKKKKIIRIFLFKSQY